MIQKDHVAAPPSTSLTRRRRISEIASRTGGPIHTNHDRRGTAMMVVTCISRLAVPSEKSIRLLLRRHPSFVVMVQATNFGNGDNLAGIS